LRRILHPCALLAWVALALALAGCGLGQVAQEEEVKDVEAILASTPSVTPTATATATNTPTATATPTMGPTSTPTNTPLPPTPTRDAALREFSFCNQEAGMPQTGRFSARLERVATESFPAFEQLALDFAPAPESAPISAEANIISARDFRLRSGEAVAPGDYVLEIQLHNWLQDEAFDTSVLSQTMTLTNTNVATSVELSFDPQADAGATVLVGLTEPVLYQLSLERDDTRLEVALSAAPDLMSAADQINVSQGTARVSSAQSLFFLLDGDIWRADSTGVMSMTQTIEDETALAFSPDGESLAFCRTDEAGFNVAEEGATVPGSLWIMETDGTQQRRLTSASIGVNCASPSFSPDGALLAFSVDETGVTPAQRSIWVLPTEEDVGLSITGSITDTSIVTVGSAQRVAGGGEWSRSAPQWLDEETLLYPASSADGRDTLFLLNLSEGEERDIGADIVVGDTYRALENPLVAPGGRQVAVVALREDEPGADLLLLDADGVQQDAISEGYWTRPLAWTNRGDLLYLTTACSSTLVQDYQLVRRTSSGADRPVVSGLTMGAVGDAATLNSNLAYVTGEYALPGPRGPNNITPYTPSDLWLWNLESGSRSIIYSADNAITSVIGSTGGR
jgi:hypothetical protein